MLTTVLLISLGVLTGAIAALKIIAPLTATSTDDKVLELLDKVPLEVLTKYVKSRS